MKPKRKQEPIDEVKRVWRIDPVRDRDLIARAEAAARDYRIVLDATDSGGFIGSVAEMPGVMAEGRSAEECVEFTRRALVIGIMALLRRGHTPVPSLKQRRREGELRREDQLNLRLSADEKRMLEQAARKQGFRSVSEFVRTRALEGVSPR